MIVKEFLCSKCKRKTFFEEISPDTWKCVECGKSRILHARIKNKNLREVYGYLYRDDDLYYFEDIVGICAIKSEDIEKLQTGEFRIPIFRVSKFGSKVI